MGVMFSLLCHTGPALRHLDVFIWNRAVELCSPAGQNHVPGLPSPIMSLVPASYHTYPPSKLCPGASCLQTTLGLSDKQARSKTSPKVCLWPNLIHPTNAGGYNKIEEISNDLISKGSGRYSTLGFGQVGCGAKSRGSPVMQLTWGIMTSRLSTSRASMWRSQSLCEHWT